MTVVFSLTVSRGLTVAETTAALADLLPPGAHLVVQPPGADVPADPGSLWATLEPTADPAWPLGLVVHTHACDLGPHPDLRLAEHLARRLAVDVLCGTDPAFTDVDPQDPSYSLALVDGRWHLADTTGARLWDDGTDGTDAPVELLRPAPVDTA
ncbi:hypothetical protein [Kitasatospora sp. NPDC088134]|uniref:hypothetical protein n=1 Tax=Kitasatospora sp. NPDC088134 TaxID=3364071 RepID=UPI0038081818